MNLPVHAKETVGVVFLSPNLINEIFTEIIHLGFLVIINIFNNFQSSNL